MAEPEVHERSYEDLSKHIVLKIFSYLTTSVLAKSVSGVCKSWWELSQHRSLWKEIRVHWKQSCIVQIKTLLVRCTELEKLYINAIEEGNAGPCHVGAQFSSLTLKDLTIEDAVVFQAELTNLNFRFPELEALCIVRCQLIGIENDFVNTISDLSELKSLKLNILEVNQHFDDGFLTTVAETFTNLEILHMHNSSNITNPCIKHLSQFRQNTLKEVKLCGLVLSDEAVLSLSLCPKLAHLGLACTANITNASFDALEDLELRTLEFHACTKKNSLVSVETLSRYFTNSLRRSLTKFALIGFGSLCDDILHDIGQNCLNLTEITIGGPELVSEEGLEHLNVLPRLAIIKVVECEFLPHEEN